MDLALATGRGPEILTDLDGRGPLVADGDVVQYGRRDAIDHLSRDELAGFWIHLDVDVLDDDVMPAVDYRLPDGLSWAELEVVLRLAFRSGRANGLEVTIFNPTLDRDGSRARALVDCLASVLTTRP